MAALAPVGVLVALPAGHLQVAASVVLIVVVLDVIAAVALYPVLKDGGELLAGIASALRLVYAAIFASAAGLLAAGNAEQFQMVWDAGLLVFGTHLVLVGVAAMRARNISTWIGIIVALAGVGYILDSLLVLLAPGAGISVGEFTFIGEVVLLVWLLGWGGRVKRAPKPNPASEHVSEPDPKTDASSKALAV